MEKEILITLILGGVGILCTIISCVIPSLMQNLVGWWKRDATVTSRALAFMLKVEERLREELSAEKANSKNPETADAIKKRIRNELCKETGFDLKEYLEPARIDKIVAKYKI